jgi:hypothetical protein
VDEFHKIRWNAIDMMTSEQLAERANVLVPEMDANDDENRVMQAELDSIYAKIDALKAR